MRIAIIGSGGHAQVCADILLSMRDAGTAVEPLGYVSRGDHGAEFLGLPVLGDEAALDGLRPDAVLVAIGDNRTRLEAAGRLAEKGWRFAAAIHPSAVIGRDVMLEPGCMVCAGAVINPGTRVGGHAILNTGCSVDHHGNIGACAHIAPGTRLAGNVTVGEGAFVGIGSSVVQGVRVGAWATVGAGAAVIEDVPDNVTVAGVPARLIG
ncbi:acetyltransferase [Salidesulfovibrio brasiliensis]